MAKELVFKLGGVHFDQILTPDERERGIEFAAISTRS
jgi:hypothetical protein